MPCGLAAADLEDAGLVANTFDVPLLKIDLTETYNVLEQQINVGVAQWATREFQRAIHKKRNF